MLNSGPLHDYHALHAALLVFIRISAAFLTAPGFGSKSVPTHIRILIAVAVSGALTMMVQHKVAPLPQDLPTLLLQIGGEAASGILIGSAISLAVTAASIAGTFLDMQVGLSMSQVMNPIDGVPITLLGQYKNMLAMVVFFGIDGHHLLIRGILHSYDGPPVGMDSLPYLLQSIPQLLTVTMSTALTIAAPALGVSLIVDSALGLLSRAVPQLQPLQIGMPVKIGAGLLAVAFTLPALVGAVTFGCETAAGFIGHLFSHPSALVLPGGLR